MKAQKITLPDLSFILGGGVAITGVWAIAVAVGDAPLPLGWLLAILGIYYITVLPAIAYASKLMATEAHRLQQAAPHPVELQREAMLINVALAHRAPVVVEVVATKGYCPMGFGIGDTWTIEGDGTVSPSICGPAAEVLSAAPKAPGQSNGKQVVSCVCPLGDYALTFALKTNG